MKNVMLLAAGHGERLAPLTRLTPKPALPVLGRPLALQLLSWLRDEGAERVVINLHHLPEVLPRVLEAACLGSPEVRFSLEPEILGTGGALRHALEFFEPGEPLIVVNGDFLCDIDLGRLLEAHRNHGHPATLVTLPPRPEYRTIEVDRDGRVRGLAGLPQVPTGVETSPRLFAGCHVMELDLIRQIPFGQAHNVRDLFRELAGRGELGAYDHDGFWWEFGTPSLHLEGCLELLRRHAAGQTQPGYFDPVRPVGEALVAQGAGVRWGDEVRCVGGVGVGFACQVGNAAQLRNTVVMPESWIGPRCRLDQVIVGPGVELPEGFEADHALVCAPDPALGAETTPLQLLPFEARPV